MRPERLGQRAAIVAAGPGTESQLGITTALVISPRTASIHVGNILAKLANALGI